MNRKKVIVVTRSIVLKCLKQEERNKMADLLKISLKGKSGGEDFFFLFILLTILQKIKFKKKMKIEESYICK